MDLGNDNYTSSAQVQTYLNRTLTADETSNLQNYVIWAASRWIDRALGSRFDFLDTSNNANWTARKYRGGQREINIDPCQQIRLVQAINPYDFSVWYTYSQPLEYTQEPYDYPVKTSLYIKMNEFTGPTLKWPPGQNSLQVTALFTEYDYVNNCYPKDIVMLCNHICGVWLQNYENTEVITRESIEGHMTQKNLNNLNDILETDPMFKRILDSRSEVWLDDMG